MPWVNVSRGFVSAVTCTAADWIQHGPALVEAHPVERVTLAGREPFFNRQLRHGWNWYGTDDPEFWERDTNAIPMAIRTRLPDLPRSEPFATRDAATDGLSAASIAWARAESARRAAAHHG